MEHAASNVSFKDELRLWAVSHNIPQNAVTDLLGILRSHTSHLLPKDCRTLLKTPRAIDISPLGNGSYCHFGLTSVIGQMYHERKINNMESSNIELLINIDGLPISKSSSAALWPILCSDDTFTKRVYIIGAFFGKQKPAKANEYLQPFVEEVKALINNGLEIDNRVISVHLKALICDAPAKAFVLSVKGHGGYNSCTKCTIEGEYIEKCVCFPYIDRNISLRTDKDFLNDKYEDFQVASTVLTQIPNFGPISNIPLDYMHLICLGVTKKLIMLWLKGYPLTIRLSSLNINHISSKLVSFKASCPKEFVRKPRPILEASNWKATEFRNFLLYTGPLVLKDVLRRDMYTNFLTLHVAVRILTSPELINDTNLEYAHSLLKHFVQTFEIIYGKDKMSPNVHNLLHITEDVRKFGPLDNFSAFRFENYMAKIKRTLRKSDKPLQQLYNRYAEIEASVYECKEERLCLQKVHTEGPLKSTEYSYTQYKICRYQNFYINCTNGKDNCFMLKDGTTVIIQNIVQDNEDEKIFIIGEKMTRTDNFYTSPCNSLDLDIAVAEPTDHTLFSWSLDELKSKLWRLAYGGNYVSLPLLHF
ncbi:unnamed protein product [Callosobruchus maculatus]|uniref:DUF4218 domain-containing protein n=1 Tax=Callosobruchus maculatus TaxID=64391 RepID=A0A653DI48_CALMS|nr:unnamed protein product [Callosobruchus maculatus]